MMRPGLNPRHEEWADSPKRSHYGKGIRDNLAGVLISTPAPVVARNVRNGAIGFRDMFGTVVNSVPYPTPLIALSRINNYDGQKPLSQQPLLNKPRPWER